MTDPATEPTTHLNRSLIILGVAISLMHIWFNVVTVLSSLWQNSLHFAGFALMASLVYPLRRNPTIAWRALDILLGLIAAGSALYLIAMEDAIYARGVRMVPAEWVAGIILILCALEYIPAMICFKVLACIKSSILGCIPNWIWISIMTINGSF